MSNGYMQRMGDYCQSGLKWVSRRAWSAEADSKKFYSLIQRNLLKQQVWIPMEKILLFHPPPPPFDLLKSPGFRFYGFRCEVHAADPSQECNKPVNRNKSSLWVDSSNNQTA
jgi:hypothetical protein